MTKKLVIVESPAKAKTIQKYLGKDYEVSSSQGHVRDLPESKFGVKINGKIEPEFEIIEGKEKIVKELKSLSKGKEVLLATDNDREGEAIAWHLASILDLSLNEKNRIVFNEITENVIKEAVKKPRNVDIKMVNSQLTRRILDRIVGYEISPLLWRVFKGKLSAGRVQSAALRILVDQEKKIIAFKPQKYYEIKAEIFNEKTKLESFDGQDLEKKPFKDEKEAKEAFEYLKRSKFKVLNVKEEEIKTKSPLPFKTSTLQQSASSILNFPVSKTMKLAQQLYEGVEIDGETVALITYMRTDSYRISDVAKKSARDYIQKNWGKEFCGESKSVKNVHNAQDAHEAIRPTYVEVSPESLKGKLSKDLFALYSMIWKRFVASQMADSIYKKRTVTVSDEKNRGIFVVEFKKRIFDGFEKVEDTKAQTKYFPDVKIDQRIEVNPLSISEEMTSPPPRYTEATLVKKLETVGIGRPSTYATIIQTLIDRKYVEREKKNLVPTFLGIIVSEFLSKEFPKIVDLKFTASMEEELDLIESGKADWQKILKEFNEDFEKNLKSVKSNLKESFISIETDIKGPDGEYMYLKYGRYGPYLESKEGTHKMNIPSGSKIEYNGEKVHIEMATPELLDEKCPKCGAPLVKRVGKYGEFISCSRYPECDYTRTIPKYARGKCPKCGGKVLERKSKKGKTFFICENNPKTCDFISWYEPSNYKCPDDGETLYYKKKKGSEVLFCPTCKKEFEESDLEKD
ncbi:type I DNA topoisomerase [Athalassotoga saccharophila]|uniref:type I DNA topoisomerase n=1 Tax=Athalassotoga saccharophila TaxID=1441386 RepID=UPI00137B9286|nr:type I DNA topoisomerase [Athalassotoga saccharophila]BBJ27984.1 DNA topoisomerase I [Athalassotoga saccharophila]